MMQKGQGIIFLIVGILAVVIIAGGAFYLGKSTTSAPSPVAASQIPQPTIASSSDTDETANWKTYTSNILSFKYPTTLTLEERQPNYLVLLSDPNPQSILVSIDARQSGDYANYDKAVSVTKAGLTNTQAEEMANGTKITGKARSGPGEGLQLTIALFKYGTSAIEVETTNTSQLQTFNQILSTFKFTQ